LFLSPLHFGLASFFIRGFCFIEPLAFWGCLFFHRRSLVLSPLDFGVASFFNGGICF
jgi:hypothetical protein